MKDLKVIFMGTPDFAVPVLKSLIENCHVVAVVTQPDKKVGRKQEIQYSPVKEVALEHGIKIFQPEKIRNDYDSVLNTECDIIITCAYGQIIPKVILDYPRLGCINVHASLLPKNRGGAPIHWCLIRGEEKTGVTIMYMDVGMDDGDIISQREYDIQASDNVGTLHDQLSLMGADLLMETLPLIVSGKNQRIKQNEEEVTFSYNIKREEEHLDFHKTGNEIINHIRGLNPWPVANMLVNQEEFKVYEATFEKKNVDIPGKVVDIRKDGIGISCLDGIIYLTKIKPFGKKMMDTRDYLNGVLKEDVEHWIIN
ncbi:MAG: methionyl-tRNA formyltransferase [Bacilli bacterium]|nr:methionyl-tRNA formyltransferase [Bacilli bacterium]